MVQRKKSVLLSAMWVCVCMCTWVCINVRMVAVICIWVSMCVCVCVCVCVNLCVCVTHFKMSFRISSNQLYWVAYCKSQNILLRGINLIFADSDPLLGTLTSITRMQLNFTCFNIARSDYENILTAKISRFMVIINYPNWLETTSYYTGVVAI